MAKRKPSPKGSPKGQKSPKNKTGRWGETAYTTERLELFLELIRRGKRINVACKEAEISRSFIYKLRCQHEAFKNEWDDARSNGFKERADEIEDTIYERAIEGFIEATSVKGQIVKAVRRYDNKLLMRLAEAELPKKYRRNIKVESEVGPSDELSQMIERIQEAESSGLKGLVKP